MSTINDLLLKHKIAQLPSQEELTPEQLKLDQIDLINDWARANPSKVLGDDLYQQRQYLTPETWRKVVAELNLTKDEILKNKKIPDHIKSTAFNNSIREATNEAAKPIAAAIIGGASVPVLAGLGSAAGVVGNTLRFGLTNPVGQQLTKKFIGDMLVGTAGSMTVNEGSRALTGKTIGDHFETVTDYVPYLNRVPGQYRNMAGEFLNIGGWMGGALFSNAANRLAGLTNRGLSYAGKQVDNLLSGNNYYRNYQLARLLNKNIRYTTLQPSAFDLAVLQGQLGWVPKQTINYRHGSLDPELKTFVPKHDRWDVTTHGADPNMYFVTDQSTPVSAANMMDRRVYQYTGNIMAEKPMVQIGEIKPAGVKNNSRNQLIARARQQGADAYIMQDIEDNQVPHLNIVARFIGPEGEAVQGGAASIKWYGPTMGKTTAVKTNPNLVDIDPLLKPIRAKHAERLGLKISDPKVSADPAYKQEVADFVLEWRANPENQGKTLVASTKHLLDPQYKVEFANEPSIPDFETFAARNKARGFKETDEQLRAWYNSILELGRDLNVDNRHVSEIESGTRSANISEAERLGIPKGERGNLQSAQRRTERYINDIRRLYLEAQKGEKPWEYNGVSLVNARDNSNGTFSLLKNYSKGDYTGFTEDTYRILQKLNGLHPSIIPIYKLMDVGGLTYLLLKKAVGSNLVGDGPDLSTLTQEQLSSLKNAISALSDNTIVIDPTWANIIYDPKIGFLLIDLSPARGLPPYNEDARLSLSNRIKELYSTLNGKNVLDFKLKQGGPIHIKKKNKGKFTESAKRAGKSVQEHARDVVNDPKATKLQKRRAQFALNSKKFKHENGGKLNYLNLF